MSDGHARHGDRRGMKHELAEEGERAIPQVHSVLATTDFSDLANRAIPQAYAVVDDGGFVHLLHVLELAEPLVPPNPLYAHYTPGRAPTPEERRRLHEDLSARLRMLVPTGASSRGIQTVVHVVEDPKVPAAIAQMAERIGASLICLGSHGR